MTGRPLTAADIPALVQEMAETRAGALAVRHTVELSNEQLQYIAGTEFVPAGLRGNLPAIMACVATGRALGLADMTALRSIHIIDGKATFSAELMVMLVRKDGHSIQGRSAEGVATVTGVRQDNGDTMTVEWTLAMAERAGLMGKQNWKRYPESMLWARAVSQLCRMLFADCFAGATYTPEELEASVGEPSPDIPGRQGTPDGAPASGARGSQASRPASPTEDTAAGTPFQYDLDAPVEPAGSRAPVYISDKQRTRLWTIAQKADVDEAALREIVRELTGQESTKLIEVGRVYEAVCAAVEAKGAA